MPPLRTIALALLGLLAAGALAALACRSRLPGAVGYAGPLPSVEARKTLTELFGRTLPPGSVGFFPDELVVHSFLVTPHFPALIVDDPVVRPPGLQFPDARGRYWIPVYRDGDIADLRRRAGLPIPLWMEQETSRGYREFVEAR